MFRNVFCARLMCTHEFGLGRCGRLLLIIVSPALAACSKNPASAVVRFISPTNGRCTDETNAA